MREIKLKGFTSTIHADDKLAIACYGEPGSGKTRFCCTAPDPIGFIPLDRKTRKTVEMMAKQLGKQVLMPAEDFIRSEHAMRLAVMKQEEAMKYYRKHVDSIKQAAFDLYTCKDIKTICIDTGSQLWEDILFANYGRAQRIMPRDRGPANQEMIDLLNCLSGKNLIITHKAREIWRNDKPTGKYDLSGFPHLGYHVNCIVEFVCNESKGEGEEERFMLNCTLCQSNPDIQGPGGKKLLLDEEIEFVQLAMRIYPDADIAEWM